MKEIFDNDDRPTYSLLEKETLGISGISNRY